MNWLLRAAAFALLGATSSIAHANDRLFAEALELERSRKGQQAVTMYGRAALEGSGKAAKRLGDIFAKGLFGVAPDYIHARRWYNVARELGEDVRMPKEMSALAEERARRERLEYQIAREEQQRPLRREPLRPPNPESSRIQDGRLLEELGRNSEAIEVYKRAAWDGSGKAALRLARIYERGIAGVTQDAAESLKWYRAARILGEHTP
jgi:TPR repeat protein